MLTEQQKNMVIAAFEANPLAVLTQKEAVRILGLITKEQVCKRFGITRGQLDWAIDNGKIPAPSFRLVRCAYYLPEQVDGLRKKLVDNSKERYNKKLTPEVIQLILNLRQENPEWLQWDIADYIGNGITQSTISRVLLNKAVCRIDSPPLY